MNTKSLLKRLIVGLCLFASLGSFTAKAQHIDTLIFKWEAAGSTQYINAFTIYATENEPFTVYWGDGSSKIYTIAEGHRFTTIGKRYADSGAIYTVTVIGSPTCQLRIFEGYFSDSRFTYINATKCRSLIDFNVRANKIDRIDISKEGNPNLRSFLFYNNRVRLTHCQELYDVTIAAGVPQDLEARTVARGDTIDFSSELWFARTPGGPVERTNFSVSNRGNGQIQIGTPVAPNTYTEQDGVLAFYKPGNYTIKMWNNNVPSASGNNLMDIAIVYQEIFLYPNTDANLASLKVVSEVGEKPLTPVFDSLTLNYLVQAGYSESYVIITATPSDTIATVSGDVGIQQLQFGVNTFAITVTAEDSITTKTYTVSVTRDSSGVNVTEAKEEEDAIRIHPNPTTGKLTIKLSVVSSQLSVELFDVVGQCVGTWQTTPEQSEIVIDISHLANGIYFLKINGEMYKVAKE